MSLNIENIRKQFPILEEKVYGKTLVYLDNAATNQKPVTVINALTEYYATLNSNIHRGVHYLSQKATGEFESVREKVRKFINAENTSEIIFVRGTTEAINLVASSYSEKYIEEGDEIVVTMLEHHSNFVPWQMACERKGAGFRVMPVNEDGTIDPAVLDKMLTNRTKLLAITHVSNTLGTVLPVKEIIELAHSRGIKVLIDGAQAIAHMPVDVRDMDCDFYCFSSHKAYGPMGIGVLYGKQELLDTMPPYHGGGEMISEVGIEHTTYNDLPYKFEAGTPNVGDTIAFGKAIEFMEELGLDNIREYEHKLIEYATGELRKIPGLKIIGDSKMKEGAISFNLENIHHFDAGTIIDKMGVAVRTGHHCTQPLMNFLGITGTIRASFAIYNTMEEVDVLVSAIKQAKSMLE